MEKEPASFSAAGSSRQLKLRQNRELQKSSANVDLHFMKESSAAILKMDGKTMDWAPDKDEAFRQLMAKASAKPQPAARSSGWFPVPMRRLLIAACVASILVVGAYADVNSRILRNPNEYAFQISVGAAESGPTEPIPAGVQSDTPLYKQLESMQIRQPLLPSADFLDSYSLSVDRLVSKDYAVNALITWKNKKNQVTFEVSDYRDADHISIMKSYPYSHMEEFVNNGLTFTLLEYRGQRRCVFHTGDVLYILTTNLDWDTVYDLARSIC